jgi:hypothetical protein
MSNALIPKRSDGQNRVDLYCNLHKKCSSIKALSGPEKGRVIDKPKDVVLANVTFRVSAAGVRRVRETGTRSVHAFARGTRTDLTTESIRSRSDSIHLRYNPFERPEFFDAISGEAIAQLAFLGVDGKTAWGIRV